MRGIIFSRQNDVTKAFSYERKINTSYSCVRVCWEIFVCAKKKRIFMNKVFPQRMFFFSSVDVRRRSTLHSFFLKFHLSCLRQFIFLVRKFFYFCWVFSIFNSFESSFFVCARLIKNVIVSLPKSRLEEISISTNCEKNWKVKVCLIKGAKDLKVIRI